MDVFAELARVGEYFAVEVGPSDAPTLTDLYAGGTVLGARIDAVTRQLGTDERRVGGSIMLQGLAARLWSPVVGAGALGLDAPRLDPATTRWDGRRLTTDEPTTGGTAREIVDRHLEPLVEAVHEDTHVSAKLLWGNAASALVGTVNVLLTQHPHTKAADLRDQLLQDERLADAGHFQAPGAGYRRTTCCLYYRVPNGGLCGDCVLVDRSTR